MVAGSRKAGQTAWERSAHQRGNQSQLGLWYQDPALVHRGQCIRSPQIVFVFHMAFMFHRVKSGLPEALQSFTSRVWTSCLFLFAVPLSSVAGCVGSGSPLALPCCVGMKRKPLCAESEVPGQQNSGGYRQRLCIPWDQHLCQ